MEESRRDQGHPKQDEIPVGQGMEKPELFQFCPREPKTAGTGWTDDPLQPFLTVLGSRTCPLSDQSTGREFSGS